MKHVYIVHVYGDSHSKFEERYTEEEIQVIEKFFNDMDKHEVASYDIPAIEFEKKTDV